MADYELLGDEEMELLMRGEDEEYDDDYEGSDSEEEQSQDSARNILNVVYDAFTRRRGIFFGLCSGTTIGIHLSMVRGLSSSISPYQVMLCRCLFCLIPVSCISWEGGVHYSAVDLVYNIGYGVCNSVGLLLGYTALQFAQVGTVTAITLNLPIPATILGFIVLREPITGFDILLFAVNLIGLIMVVKPPFFLGNGEVVDASAIADATVTGLDEFIGAVIAIGGLLCLVTSVIFSRKLAYREHSDPALTTVLPGTAGLFMTAGIILFSEKWDNPSSALEIALIASAGVFGLLANLFLVLALKHESVLVSSVMATTCVPVSYVVGVVVLNEIPDLMSTLGAILVFATTCGCLWK